jgi:hypothetical protein
MNPGFESKNYLSKKPGPETHSSSMIKPKSRPDVGFPIRFSRMFWVDFQSQITYPGKYLI